MTLFQRITLLAFCALFGATNASAAPGASQRETADFDFHSGVWINLHHFLYAQAAAQSGRSRRSPKLIDADVEHPAYLSPDEQRVWRKAMAYYNTAWVDRDLLFDDALVAIKNRLEDAEASRDLSHVRVPAALREVLTTAEPIYRKH